MRLLRHYLDGDNRHVVMWPSGGHAVALALDELVDVLACYVPCRCGAWASVASGECPTCHDAAETVSTDQRYR